MAQFLFFLVFCGASIPWTFIRECVCLDSVTYALSSINRYLALKTLRRTYATLGSAGVPRARACKMCYLRLRALSLSLSNLFRDECMRVILPETCTRGSDIWPHWERATTMPGI